MERMNGIGGMEMRLIDADLLKENISRWLKPSKPDETEMIEAADALVSTMMEIDEQPTAFDVDKVVEQLKQLKMRYFLTIANTGNKKLDIAYENVGNTLDRVIEIVKGGGAE